jgi:hypothetical protein
MQSGRLGRLASHSTHGCCLVMEMALVLPLAYLTHLL